MIVTLCYWLRPATPREQAETYSKLEIPAETRVLSYFTDNSLLLDGGITCGELELGKDQISSVISEALNEGYTFTDILGGAAPTSLVLQSSCCEKTNAGLNMHKGFYKVFSNNAKESQCAIIDTKVNRLYFFKAKASNMF